MLIKRKNSPNNGKSLDAASICGRKGKNAIPGHCNWVTLMYQLLVVLGWESKSICIVIGLLSFPFTGMYTI